MLIWMLAMIVWRLCGSIRFDDGRADEFVEFGIFAIEIGVAALEHLVLMAGSHAAAGALSVTAVKFFDDVHAFDDLAEGSEAGFDVVAGGVIAEVDVDLRGSCVGSGVGEGDVAWGVVLL